MGKASRKKRQHNSNGTLKTSVSEVHPHAGRKMFWGGSFSVLVVFGVLFIFFLHPRKQEFKGIEFSEANGFASSNYVRGYSEVPIMRLPVLEAKLSVPNGNGSSLQKLLSLAPAQLEGLDIGEMDLVCAQGLPGSEDLDIPTHLGTLAQWAEHVHIQTESNMHRFREHPEKYGNSEVLFRVGLLITILQQDFGVHYDVDQYRLCMECREVEREGRKVSSESVFKDSKLMFINGALGLQAKGTCASLPVVYMAVGRRLGYPLKLVAAKHHFFIRWEDGKNRINFDGSGDGFNSYFDDYYRKWPAAISDQEIKNGYYLKSMTASEELGAFLLFRAECLRVAGRKDEGHEIIEQALQKWNHHPAVENVQKKIWQQGFLTVKEKEMRTQGLAGSLLALRAQNFDPVKLAELEATHARLRSSPGGLADDLRTIESLERKILDANNQIVMEKQAKQGLEVYRINTAVGFGGKEAYEKRLKNDPWFANQQKMNEELIMRSYQGQAKIQEQNEALISGWEPDPLRDSQTVPSNLTFPKNNSHENKTHP